MSKLKTTLRIAATAMFLGMLAVIIAIMALFTASMRAAIIDNPSRLTRNHVLHNLPEITRLADQAARERAQASLDTSSLPHRSQSGERENRDIRDGARLKGRETYRGTAELTYDLEEPDQGTLAIEYVLILDPLTRHLMHPIPGRNWRIRDAYLDAASIRATREEDRVRAEAALEKTRLRLHSLEGR